jgi:hypothetical protein
MMCGVYRMGISAGETVKARRSAAMDVERGPHFAV